MSKEQIVEELKSVEEKDDLLEEMALLIEGLQNSKMYCAITQEGKHRIYDVLTRYNQLAQQRLNNNE
jgi:hypothetical protein